MSNASEDSYAEIDGPGSRPDTHGTTMRKVRSYLLISIAIHLLLILLWRLPDSGSPRAKPDEWEEQQAKRAVFELIEIPDDVPEEEPVTPTNLVSDKSTRAADMTPELPQQAADPHSTGDSDFRVYDGVESAEVPSDQLVSADEPEERDWATQADPRRNIDYLAEMTRPRQASRPGEAASYRSVLSGAERQGGIRFNTYDWDFAPYMLAMKRKVESHMYPPYAFTHMGLVSGTNVIHFIVLPDGSVRDLKILTSNAHFSLDLTSIRAIELSLPFLPLPKGFPEDYLEVTAHFSYLIDR